MKKMAVVVAFALALVGCASSGEETTSENAPADAVAETATVQQVASLIAENNTQWREFAEGSADCRITWVMDDPSDPVAAIRGTSCFYKEITASVSANLALRDLSQLTPPAELESLVDRTEAILLRLSEANIIAVCGEDDWPAKTDECNDVLAKNFMGFNELIPVLDAWKPYI